MLATNILLSGNNYRKIALLMKFMGMTPLNQFFLPGSGQLLCSNHQIINFVMLFRGQPLLHMLEKN